MLHFNCQAHPAVNGVLILFNGVNKNPGSAKQRTYVNEATSRFYFFNFVCFFFNPIETTNETWIGRGDCYVFEMLIKFRSEIRVGSHSTTQIVRLRTGLIKAEPQEEAGSIKEEQHKECFHFFHFFNCVFGLLWMIPMVGSH